MQYTDYFADVMKVMSTRGLLLASWKPDGTANAMTIGWGMIGSVWSRPMWQVMVRPSRYTYELLKNKPFFSVNVMPVANNNALQLCGASSGHNQDKLTQCGLTASAGSAGAPVIEQSLIHYECQIVHANDFVPEAMVPDIRQGCYPSGDFHRIFWGQILDCRINPEVLNQMF